MGVSFTILVGIPAAFAFLVGWLRHPKEHMIPLILGGMFLFFVLLAFVLVLFSLLLYSTLSANLLAMVLQAKYGNKAEDTAVAALTLAGGAAAAGRG